MKTLFFGTILLVLLMLPVAFYGQLLTDTSEQQDLPGFRKSNVQMRMVSQLYTAYAVDDHEFQMARLTLKPEIKVNLHQNLRFTGIARFYSEAQDKLEPGKPDQSMTSKLSRRILIGNRLEVELREFYFDWYIGKHTALRLGKQQIVWGETDGLKLLDVVNPQNFREFMLEEFEDSRIPLWTAKAEFPLKGLDIEMVWIPDMSYHIIPESNTLYFPRAMVPELPNGVTVQMLDREKPNRLFLDSDIGARASAFISGWDLTLNYFFHYDDFPVFKRHLLPTPGGEPSLRIQPQYKRMHTLGGTFNNTFGPITLRGELAYHFGRHFNAASLSDTDGIVKSDQLLLAVGMDWPMKETLLSVQFFNDLILKDGAGYPRKKYDPNISLFMSQEFLHDDLKLQVLLVQNLQNAGGMVRPQVSYLLRSNVKLLLGSDIFYGNRRGVFGEFRDRSRFVIGVEWGI